MDNLLSEFEALMTVPMWVCILVVEVSKTDIRDVTERDVYSLTEGSQVCNRYQANRFGNDVSAVHCDKRMASGASLAIS